MKYLLPTLLALAARPAQAAPPPVPATLDVAGLHLTLDADAQRLVQLKVSSLCRHPASLAARVALAEAALPVVDRVLAEEGVPADFRYLVLQESALQGNAVSAHGAVGYWQLKAETARELGLTVNEQVDERQHLTASTRAAARYLRQHQARTRNWANTLLCYYLGATGARALIQPADADAPALTLTATTCPYLFDFVAQKLVFEPACAAGTVPFVPWQEVPAPAGQRLPELAARYHADPAEAARLNPWLLAEAVPADGRAYTVLLPLPAEAAVTPTSPVAVSPATPPTAPGTYTVAAGDTFYSIARRYRCTPEALRAHNERPDFTLHVGEQLRVPQ